MAVKTMLELQVSERETIAARVERVVQGRTGGRIRDLVVLIGDDRVILHGLAPTYYAKQLATHAALDELSGETLINSIEVV